MKLKDRPEGVLETPIGSGKFANLRRKEKEND